MKLFVILDRFAKRGYTQVTGYNRFGYLSRGDSFVMVSRENGKEARIPFTAITQAIDAVRADPTIYEEGPARLREFGMSNITSPVWSLLHLMTLEELLK